MSSNYWIVKIDHKTATDFLLPRHYSGRKPLVSLAYGLYLDEVGLIGVVTYGKPANKDLCTGICGKENSKYVYELNRICIDTRGHNMPIPLSQFVSYTLRQIKELNWIVVSYSDTDMSHVGYIYQALNFYYTGLTKARLDFFLDGKHNRASSTRDRNSNLRVMRSAKHRYVLFCTKNKKLKKQWLNSLNYEIQPYPKGESKRYELGYVLEKEIIEV